ncbi:ribonuclease Z [Persephonella sp.]
MKGKLVLLGTSSAMPTPDRNNSGVYLQYRGKGFLFDCGEGTQRQIMKAGLSIFKVDNIFISHFHTDHILGLPGLIETLDMHGKTSVNLFSLKGLEELMGCVLNGMIYAPEIKINFHQFSPEKEPFTVYEDKNYIIKGIGLNHVVDCVGYSFEEKPVKKFDPQKVKELALSKEDFIQLKTKGFIKKYGRLYTVEELTFEAEGFKFTYIPDTYKTDRILKLAEGSDILVIECTYLDEEDKAKEYGHLTLEYILEILPQLNCKKVILTHFSRRYTSMEPFEKK